MAGNDKPNLSDLKARLSFRLGEQSAIQAPAPTAQSSGQGQRQASQQQWQQSQQQYQQDPSQQQWAGQQQADYGYGQQAQQAYDQQQYAAQQGQQAYAQDPYAQQQQQAAYSQQAQQQQYQAAAPQPAATAQAHQGGQAGQGGQGHQAAAQAHQAAQGHQAGQAAGQARSQERKGGLKDLQASFDSSEAFSSVTNDTTQFKGNPILTLGGTIIAIAAFVFGALFAYMYSTGSQKRQLFTYQIKDAKEGYDALKPKVNAFDKLRDAVNQMADQKTVDIQKVQALGSYDIVVNGSPFNSTRVLLGGSIISPIMRYLVDSAAIKNMIDEHIRLTMQSKDEIMALSGGNSPLAKYDYFAVTFNSKGYCENSTKPNYIPENGHFAYIGSAQPVEGKYKIKTLAGNDYDVDAKVVIPVDKKEVIMVQGAGNALQRYNQRLDAIKRRVASVDYTATMLQNLEKVAKEPLPSFFSF